jgi:hypothetical protein
MVPIRLFTDVELLDNSEPPAKVALLTVSGEGEGGGGPGSSPPLPAAHDDAQPPPRCTSAGSKPAELGSSGKPRLGDGMGTRV